MGDEYRPVIAQLYNRESKFLEQYTFQWRTPDAPPVTLQEGSSVFVRNAGFRSEISGVPVYKYVRQTTRLLDMQEITKKPRKLA